MGSIMTSESPVEHQSEVSEHMSRYCCTVLLTHTAALFAQQAIDLDWTAGFCSLQGSDDRSATAKLPGAIVAPDVC